MSKRLKIIKLISTNSHYAAPDFANLFTNTSAAISHIFRDLQDSINSTEGDCDHLNVGYFHSW